MRGGLILAALLAAALPPAGAASDPEIEVQALFTDRALLVVDGRPRLLAAGDTSPEGITLESASSRGAVVRVNGRRLELALGGRIGSDYAPPREQRVRVVADGAGMYRHPGTIDGIPVRFVLDTGSTLISLNEPLARRLGLAHRERGTPGESVTASGVVNMWRVRLARVTVGDIELREVDAAVLEGEFPQQPLLGNSFLGRVQMTRRDGALELARTW